MIKFSIDLFWFTLLTTHDHIWFIHITMMKTFCWNFQWIYFVLCETQYHHKKCIISDPLTSAHALISILALHLKTFNVFQYYLSSQNGASSKFCNVFAVDTMQSKYVEKFAKIYPLSVEPCEIFSTAIWDYRER